MKEREGDVGRQGGLMSQVVGGEKKMTEFEEKIAERRQREKVKREDGERRRKKETDRLKEQKTGE